MFNALASPLSVETLVFYNWLTINATWYGIKYPSHLIPIQSLKNLCKVSNALFQKEEKDAHKASVGASLFSLSSNTRQI